MGNIVQCCHTLSNYFKCNDVPVQGEPERSPLLSSEESECDSPSLPDDLGEDLSTICVTNPTLEPENFLFPDIVLSSSLGGNVTLVEPMVCLLVSEEEAGARVQECGDGGRERCHRGRDREYYEVETQTEVETQIGTGIQTQTELQAQSKALANEVVVDTWPKHETLKQVDVVLDARADTKTSEERLDSGTWSAIDGSVELELPEKVERSTEENKVTLRDTDKEAKQEGMKQSHITQGLTANLTKHTFQTEQNTMLNTGEEAALNLEQNTDPFSEELYTLPTRGHVNDSMPIVTNLPRTSSIQEAAEVVNTFRQQGVKAKGQNMESQCTPVMLLEDKVNNVDEKIAPGDSQKRVKLPEYNNTEDFVPAECEDLTRRSKNQMGQETVLSGHNVSGEEHNVIQTKANINLPELTAYQSVLNADHIERQENLCPPKRTGDSKAAQLETPLRQDKQEEEEGAEMKQMTLFAAERLFLAGAHVEAPPSHTEGGSEGGPHQLLGVDENKQSDIHVDPQDTVFTVRIQPPGAESFELQVSGQLLVAELHQVLMEHEVTCHRTCFSLQLGDTTLDGLTKLCSIQGMRDGALIKVVEASYSVRDARLHLRHVRELLRSLDPSDAYNGVNCSSLTYLSFYTRGERDRESLGNRWALEKESAEFRPPEYLIPGCKDRPLTPLQPVRDDRKPVQCLRVLTMNGWNPPPGNRKMHGDLMYLNVVTMEDKELNITSATRGFYLNQSTAFNFNPKPAVPKILCHSLVELLSQVSPAFRKTFSALQKRRVLQHPYERIATPFQVFTWVASQGDHALDCVRAEEMHTSHMGQEEHTAGQSRDWNEELQGCRELPRTSPQECLHRERSIFKTNSDFVEAATRGAVAVIDGHVLPLNPGEPPHMQMFIWNNLFFSLGFDISDHYHPIGGNTAAHAAALCDLRGAQAYMDADVEGLYTLGTAVVDYRGIRVIAQMIVPGILEKHQEQSVVYGSNDYGKTVFTHPRFLELLEKTIKPLRIQRHQVLDQNNSPVELCSSIETKGILGNDSRPYILDLLRTFPPDLNFQFSQTDERKEVPKECESFGYPRRHHHNLASLRPELIEAFVQHRYKLYVKMVTEGLTHLEEQKNSQCEQSEEPRTGDSAAAAVDMGSQRRNVILSACKAVGSVSQTCFDIRFNPDVCSPGVRFPSECVAEVERQRLLLWEAAAFLLSSQIPAVLRDCLNLTAAPMDGVTLTSALHRRGVNVRYLGTVLREVDKAEERRRLSHIQRICLSEVILRSAKHIFRTYLQDVEPAVFSAAVSHFLNCLLSSSSCFPDSCSDELLSRRRSRRRRSHGGRVALLRDGVWTKLTPSELWSRIRTEAEGYYHYTIDGESIEEVIEKHSLQRISLLREITIKTGIQVQLREYVFESRHRPAFGEEDVVNMFPVVKHLKPKGTDAMQLVQHAQALIQQGLLKDAHELVGRALALFSSVCGVLHEDVCLCLRLLGRLSYNLGEYADALNHQEKAAMSSERLHGIDHPQTIQDYTHMALYCFAGGRLSTSLQLLYRARYLSLLVIGEDHPQVALLDSMLGLVLHGLMEYELSLKFLQNALISTSKYHGATSLKYAQSHHLLATVYESKGEFRSALQHEKEAYSIYNNKVGEDHESTKESSEYLKSLTQQAVVLQKAINHIYSNAPSACAPPPKFSTPSLPIILQQLNLTCGITFIQFSEKELADLRTEVQKKLHVEELEICVFRQSSEKDKKQ